MKNLVGLVLLAALAYGGYTFYQNAQSDYLLGTAEKRVEEMLTAHARGDEQAAISQWAAGKPTLSSDELAANTDSYAAFASTIGIRKGITWSVNSATAEGAGVRVVADIAGRTHAFLVVSHTRIEPLP